MPCFDIVREVESKRTFRVASVMDQYDLQSNRIKERFTGDLDLSQSWQIGAIVGASGTGKTTIAKELFPDSYVHNYKYNADAIVDDMPERNDIGDITAMFVSVGFSSVPSWLKPFAVLSQGEQMRVNLANALLTDKSLIVFDEFTSVVDRNIAKIGSYAVQKAIKKTDKQFIAVSCHYDILDWLLPDWVFNTDDMTLTWCDKKKDRKSISEYAKGDNNIGKCLLDTII